MDRVCIVTGGTSGIGLATATRLAAEGARVAIVGRDGTRGRAAESGLRASPPDAASERAAPPGQAARGSVPEREAVFEQADVASEADVRRVVAAVVDRWGRVDILVNNAAMMTFRPVVDLSVDDWDRVLGVNLRGAFLFARACIPHMHRGGAIVNVSSVHAHETTIDVVPCAASKGAQEAFTRALSRELAPRNIRVNCVAPGAVDTPMLWSNPHVRGSRLREPPGALRPGPAGAPSGPRVRGDDPTVAGGAPVGAAVPGALAGPRPGGRDGRSGRWRAAQRSGRDAAATARVGGPPALESRS